MNYTKTCLLLFVGIFVVRVGADLAMGLDPWRSMGGGAGVAIVSTMMMLPIFAAMDLAAWLRERRRRRAERRRDPAPPTT